MTDQAVSPDEGAVQSSPNNNDHAANRPLTRFPTRCFFIVALAVLYPLSIGPYFWFGQEVLGFAVLFGDTPAEEAFLAFANLFYRPIGWLGFQYPLIREWTLENLRWWDFACPPWQFLR